MTLSLCAPLGVAVGGACTTPRAARSAARNASGVETSGTGCAGGDADGEPDIGKRRAGALHHALLDISLDRRHRHQQHIERFAFGNPVAAMPLMLS